MQTVDCWVPGIQNSCFWTFSGGEMLYQKSLNQQKMHLKIRGKKKVILKNIFKSSSKHVRRLKKVEFNTIFCYSTQIRCTKIQNKLNAPERCCFDDALWDLASYRVHPAPVIRQIASKTGALEVIL